MVFITVYLPMNNTEKHKQNKTKSTLEELLYISTFDIFADILDHYHSIPFSNKI